LGEGESRSGGGEGFKATEIGEIPAEWEVVLLAEAEKARGVADRDLDAVLGELGFGGWRSNG
jgi:hypothetical protein